MVVVEELTEKDIEFVLDKACESMPDAESAKMLRAGLQKMYDQPALADLEKVIRKRMNIQKARQLLFWPEPEDMALYVKLLASPPTGAPDSHPQRKAQIQAMSLFYLKHVKRWSLLEAFILADGLPTLVDVFVDSNLYIRGQAIDAFMQITAPPDFDWHAEVGPKDPSVPVRNKLKALVQGPIIKNLLQNYHGGFPGGSFYCLQIFAFYVSWLRYFYCPNRVLRLSKHILGVLNDWKGRDDISSDEQRLADNLYEDFNRFPPADEGELLAVGDVETSDGNGTGTAKGSSGATSAEGASAARALTLKPEELKDLGNAAFKRKDFDEAIKLYTRALDRDSEMISLYSNRAFAYVKRGLVAQEGGDLEKCQEDMRAALADCDSGLERDQKHVKSIFRRAQALFHLGRYDESHQYAVRARSLIAEPEVQQLIADLRVKQPSLCEEDPSSPRPKSPSSVKAASRPKGKTTHDSRSSSQLGAASDITRLAALFDDVNTEYLPTKEGRQAARHTSQVIQSGERGPPSPEDASYVQIRSEDFYDSQTDSDDEV
eukprot:TRINITY_DN15034_c0_g1_i1.p1 TRINITY_DN15034_c0_g1~~TRINITY_DN15034_c0_g1_i1.p1  ORF type:complete len:545 (-),score=72.19 TRINITY_DN15034_c0_g1_i1:134-1768(-)